MTSWSSDQKANEIKKWILPGDVELRVGCLARETKSGIRKGERCKSPVLAARRILRPVDSSWGERTGSGTEGDLERGRDTEIAFIF